MMPEPRATVLIFCKNYTRHGHHFRRNLKKKPGISVFSYIIHVSLTVLFRLPTHWISFAMPNAVLFPHHSIIQQSQVLQP